MRHIISAVALMLLYSSGYAAIGTITEQVNAPPSIVRKSSVLAAGKGSGVEADDNVRTTDRKSTRLNSSHVSESRMPSSA